MATRKTDTLACSKRIHLLTSLAPKGEPFYFWVLCAAENKDSTSLSKGTSLCSFAMLTHQHAPTSTAIPFGCNVAPFGDSPWTDLGLADEPRSNLFIPAGAGGACICYIKYSVKYACQNDNSPIWGVDVFFFSNQAASKTKKTCPPHLGTLSSKDNRHSDTHNRQLRLAEPRQRWEMARAGSALSSGTRNILQRAWTLVCSDCFCFPFFSDWFYGLLFVCVFVVLFP